MAQQDEHHRQRRFVEGYGLQWRKEEETVKNGFTGSGPPEHLAEARC